METALKSLAGMLAMLGGMLWADSGTPQMQLSAEASVRAYEAGHSFLIAVKGKLPEGWHAYYRNPGSAGLGMEVRLHAPAGFVVQGPYWRAPQRIVSKSSTVYGYEEPVAVWQITPHADAPGEAQFNVSAEVQLCNDLQCSPPTAEEAQLILRRGQAVPNPEWGEKEKLVETLGDAPVQQVSVVRSAGGYELALADPGFSGDPIFISEDNAVHPALPQTTRRKDGMLRLLLPANKGEDPLYPAPSICPHALNGQLVWPNGEHSTIAAPVQGGGAHGMPSDFPGIVLGLFLGGILLNLMPCVFPVLGLKVMNFVQLSGGSSARVVAHSLAFVLGILLSFVLLGSALVVVSNMSTLANTPWQDWLGELVSDVGGEDRNWAAWMQNEWVVYGLTVLLLVLGLGMYGVFEIGVSATSVGQGVQQSRGVLGAFLQGLLVTLVATPCSAPFLGAAMPAAMALPGLWLVAALVAMGLGLGLPYIILSLFPRLVGLLPRPGQWMESLKQALSFLMIGAAAWLLDVYLSMHSEGSSLSVLLGMVGMGAACWVYGRWCPMYRSTLSRICGLMAALALTAGSVWLSMPRVSKADEEHEPYSSISWEAWTPEGMKAALEQGDPVYVDFTAKWCATCLANKSIAYTEEVRRLLNERGVVLMRADKTKDNPAIDAEMRRLGRSAVPTNALYVPDKEPVVTRELLSPGYLLEFLQQHLPPAEREE